MILTKEEREASLVCNEMEAEANQHIAQQIVDGNAALRSRVLELEKAVGENWRYDYGCGMKACRYCGVVFSGTQQKHPEPSTCIVLSIPEKEVSK